MRESPELAIRNQAQRDAIVLKHLPLVKSIASRVRATVPALVELDDLQHAGVLGLIDAAGKFDATKEVSFVAYAKLRIRGAMLDSLRQLDWAPRHRRQHFRRIAAVTAELTAELKRIPTQQELADRLEISVEQLHHLQGEMHSATITCATDLQSPESEVPAPDFAANAATHPDSMYSRAEMRAALDRAMTRLPDRYRRVVAMYYSGECTMKDIGAALGVNESRVSQIHKAALAKMHEALAEVGISGAGAF